MCEVESPIKISDYRHYVMLVFQIRQRLLTIGDVRCEDIDRVCGISLCYHVGAVVQLVEYRTCNREVASSTHTRSTASNLEQVANLLCAQVNSASYPQRDGK